MKNNNLKTGYWYIVAVSMMWNNNIPKKSSKYKLFFNLILSFLYFYSKRKLLTYLKKL